MAHVPPPPPDDEESVFDDTVVATAKFDIKFVNWDATLQPGMLICLVVGHGNMAPSEWRDERQTTLDMATGLSASLGNPGFVSSREIRDMTRIVGLNIERRSTMKVTIESMISCLKQNITMHSTHEQKKFRRSTPEFSGISNVFRNRSWDFEIGTGDKFYFYQCMHDGNVRAFRIDPDRFPHTRHGNMIRVFKSELISRIERKYAQYNAAAPPPPTPITKFLLLDAACNGREGEGMNSTELRAFMSEVGQLTLNGTRGPVILGGTKRRNKRKSLKKKFK
jgi:hypothetical protein